ncbi:MAG: hypothetical protein DRI46_13250 [Chloroflexi bacterium]|nr:MAG: hypothetical protein DRI46_13250 [Chloroflexota bacterium]
MVKIVLPYTPRPLQRTVHDGMGRFAVIVCHRRWGKTVFSINELIRTALTCPHPNPRTAYICPLHKQAKTVAWDMVKEFSRPIPGIQFNESELRADYPNGGRLQLFGADNADGLRGMYLDHVCMDEYAQMSPRAWSEVIRPALSDRKGKAIFIGTPMGRGALYNMYQRAEELPGWTQYLYKASETGIIDPDELEAARREMSDEEYSQEYECSWSAAIRGAYYSRYMDEAERDGRITNVPHDPNVQVITSWDLGIADATVIWFWQVVGAEIRAINCLAFKNTGLPEIIKEIGKLPYNYSQHIAPHDAMVRELGSGRSRYETAQGLGVQFIIADKQSIADGINSVRAILPRVWFDKEKCKDGIEALRQYRTEWNDKLQVFSANPLHNWCADYTDSMRYFAVTPITTGMNSQYSDWNVSINL